MIKEKLNWVKNNLDSENKYVKRYEWAGEDMYIDFYPKNMRENIKFEGCILNGNLIKAHFGPKELPKKVLICKSIKIVGFKYFKDKYIHYQEIEGNEDDSFEISDNLWLKKNIYLNNHLLSKISVTIDPKTGEFTISSFDFTKYQKVKLCGIKLEIEILRSEDLNSISIMNKGWHNYSIIKQNKKFCPSICNETLFAEIIVSDAIEIGNKLDSVSIKFDNPKDSIIYKQTDTITHSYLRKVSINCVKNKSIPDKIEVIINGNNLNKIKSISIIMKSKL